MLQVAHPTSDLFNVGWAPTPLYSRVNGINPNDAGPVVCPLPPGGSFEVQLGILARPITGPHTLTVRGLATAPGVALISFFLLQGTSFIAGRSVQPTQSFVNYDLVLTENEVDLITDYTNLRVLVIASGSGGSGGSGGSTSAGSTARGSLSGSGSGSGASGGPMTVIVPCCENPIPLTLYATFTNGTGDCVCFNGLVIPLSFQGFDPFGLTASWDGSATVCGMSTAVDIICVTEGGWIQGTQGCLLENAYPDINNCDPFLLVWSNSPVLNCCSGTVTMTVTDEPP